MSGGWRMRTTVRAVVPAAVIALSVTAARAAPQTPPPGARATAAPLATHTCVVTDRQPGPWPGPRGEVLCLEQRLRDVGYLDAASVDGWWGPADVAAIRAAQQYLTPRGVSSGRAGVADRTFLRAIGAAVVPGPANPARRCRVLGVIGDSLTFQSIPVLLGALYGSGLDTVVVAAHGRRAIMTHTPDDLDSGLDAAAWMRRLPIDCWLVAIGTNDVIDIARGAADYSHRQAIEAMMTAIDPAGRAPVLWVNLRTAAATGRNANANMVTFNGVLRNATRRWKNLHVADWAATRPGGFKQDGVHLNPAAQRTRAAWIASELARQIG